MGEQDVLQEEIPSKGKEYINMSWILLASHLGVSKLDDNQLEKFYMAPIIVGRNPAPVNRQLVPLFSVILCPR